MHAIILDRNKQYIVEDKRNLKVDFIDAEIGTVIKMDKVLLYSNDTIVNIGTPFIENKIISFEIVKHIKDDKKLVLKFKRRKHHMKKKNHRQKYTLLKLI